MKHIKIYNLYKIQKKFHLKFRPYIQELAQNAFCSKNGHFMCQKTICPNLEKEKNIDLKLWSCLGPETTGFLSAPIDLSFSFDIISELDP